MRAMRFHTVLLMIAAAVIACGDSSEREDTDAAPEQGAADARPDGDDAAPGDAAPPDGATGAGCEPSGGCTDGPMCGAVCCGVGEACVEGECRCGGGAACENPDACMTAGPEGETACGFICCHGPTCPD